MTARFHAGALGALFAGLFAAGSAAAQATVTVVNNDGPGEGFNDATAVAAVAGNPGTTLGQQRLNAFQAAADDWGSVLTSAVEIRIAATMDAMTPCTANAGVLGAAGPLQAFRDFTNAPVANTFYSAALANAISGIDNGAGTDDLRARFNSDVDSNPGCLSGTTWFYGIGVPAPANTISFYDTVKHEIGHGVGFLSFVDLGSGQKLGGRDDIYSNFLHDHSSGVGWPAMTDAERLASMTDTGDLHWTGPRVNACAAQILTAGMAGGHVRMFAPSPIQPGSSVSHFDTALDPDELMEPFATASSDQRLTDRLLADTGWDVVTPTCGPVHNPAISPIVHNPPLSPVHIPVGSPVHNPRISPVHFPGTSPVHRPPGSIVHHPVLSPTHFPPGSRVHSPWLSPTHYPPGSVSHFPPGSLSHQPPGSIHSPGPSRFGGGFEPGFDDPYGFGMMAPWGTYPGMQGGGMMPPGTADPGMMQPGTMQPGGMQPGAMPVQPGGQDALPEGLEFVPGNRAGVAQPPMPRGMPYSQ